MISDSRLNSMAAKMPVSIFDGSRKDVSMMSKHATEEQDPIKKLNSMEEYCKKENIFFNENDRIKH